VGPGDVTLVQLLIEDSLAAAVQFEYAKPVGILELANGSHLHVIATRGPLPDGWCERMLSNELAEAAAVRRILLGTESKRPAFSSMERLTASRGLWSSQQIDRPRLEHSCLSLPGSLRTFATVLTRRRSRKDDDERD
jgi:hypothetical protein